MIMVKYQVPENKWFTHHSLNANMAAKLFDSCLRCAVKKILKRNLIKNDECGKVVHPLNASQIMLILRIEQSLAKYKKKTGNGISLYLLFVSI